MDTAAIISALDDEIGRLQQARAILTSLPTNDGVTKRGRGRPKATTEKPEGKKRNLSDEARAKIAAAQKKRWAAKAKSA